MLLIDSDIIIDAGRGNDQAKAFLAKFSTQYTLAISTITRLELLAGCRNSREWEFTELMLRQFTELELTPDISQVTVLLFNRYRQSHGIALADGFIAATALSHNLPFASKNQRHFHYIANLNLLPYFTTP